MQGRNLNSDAAVNAIGVTHHYLVWRLTTGTSAGGSYVGDGQDDRQADEVWGGPNGAYSLAHARRNFLRHLVMYVPAQPSKRTGGLIAVERLRQSDP